MALLLSVRHEISRSESCGSGAMKWRLFKTAKTLAGSENSRMRVLVLNPPESSIGKGENKHRHEAKQADELGEEVLPRSALSLGKMRGYLRHLAVTECRS